MRLTKISLIFLILLTSVLHLSAREEKTRVAILDMELTGMDSSMIPIFTNRFRAELITTDEFDVMERNRMEEILQEQGFQQTGACTSDECLVEAGRMLGVARMIAGSVGKVGTLFTITARMIDVETGRILLSVTEDTPKPVENVLTESLKNTAEKLSVQAAAADDKLTGFGSLSITSDPVGARIFLDGKILPDVTPFVIDSIATGVHVLRLQKDVLAASKAIFIAPKEMNSIDLSLTMAKGTLKVIADPPDVEIFIDHKSRGTAPKQITDLPVGSYFLKLTKQGFVENTRIVTIKENETTVISAKLVRMAFLSITAQPLDCEVAIDDSVAGKTPLHSYPLNPGFHKISVRKNGFVNWDDTRSLPAGELTSLHVILKRVATLFINSEPAEAEIYIDGLYRGNTPLTISDLPPGMTDIKLEKQYFEDHRAQIGLAEGETKNLNVNLVRKTGILKIQTIPSNAQVELDGKIIGSTPLELNDIPFGNHRLVLSKQGFQAVKQDILIESHLPELVSVNFEIARGILFLQPNPRDARIYLDGKKIDGQSTMGLELFPGQYNVRAERPGYEKFSTTADIKPDDGFSLKIDMQKKTWQNAVWRSAILPGWGQHYAEKKTRTHLFPILEACALTGAVISDLIYDDHISDYNTARRKYMSAISEKDISRFREQAQDAYDSAGSAKDTRRGFVYAAAGIWLLNILDAAIFPPVQPVLLPDQYGLNLSVPF